MERSIKNFLVEKKADFNAGFSVNYLRNLIGMQTGLLLGLTSGVESLNGDLELASIGLATTTALYALVIVDSFAIGRAERRESEMNDQP